MDRMDDIWKDRFNSEDLPLGEWNTPDDMVWQNIANNTVREDNKKPALLWVWLATGLLILLLGIMLLNGNKYLSNSLNFMNTNDTGQIIESTKEETLTNVSSRSVSQKYVIPASSNHPNELTQIASNNNKSIEEKPRTEKNKAIAKSGNTINIHQSQKFKTSLNLSNNALVNNEEAIPVSTQPAITSIENQKNLQNNSTPNNPPITNPATNPLDEFNNSSLILLTTNAAIEEVQVNVKDDFKKSKAPFPISLNAAVGVSYWKHVISNNYTSDLSAFDFNYTDEFGYLLDIDASIPLGKRFAISTGFDYEQINISSGHNSSLNYNPADEDASASNAYALSLATPYGLAGAEFRFDRREEIGDNPVELLVDFHSGHTIKNFSVPLNLEYYPLGTKAIISPTVKAGVGINFLSGITNEIKAIDTHHDAIQYDDSGTSSFMAPNITKWHYDYRLGLGARIQWRSDFAIVVNYERVGGINSIFQQDAYKTRINRQHLSIGLSKVILNIR